MDLRRLRGGELLAMAGGLALLIDLVAATWFSVPGIEVNGFEAFSVVDVLLAFAGLLGIGVGVTAALREAPAVPVANAVICAFWGVLMVPVLAIRLVNEPGENALVDVRYGACAGLIALVAVAAGAWLALRDEHRDVA